MADIERLPVGRIVSGVVTEHEHYGIHLRLDDAAREAVVDLIYVHEYVPFELRRRSIDYPPIGSRVTGVVQLYTASGQLRVSLRESDIAVARSHE